MEYLSHQMAVLVLDPKLFRRPETWQLLAQGVPPLLAATANAVAASSADGDDGDGDDEPSLSDLLSASAAACKVAAVVVNGARALGLRAQESKLHGAISGSGDGSIFR